MSTIKKTNHDGWGCAPALGQTSKIIRDFEHLFYEIENCVRAMSTKDMLTELRYFVECIDEGVAQAENELDGVEFQTLSTDEKA